MIKRYSLYRRFAAHLAEHKLAFYRKAGFHISIDERGGAYFLDISGRKYINCHSNGGVFNLGHRYKPVINAVTEAMQHVDIGNHHLVSEKRIELAEKLTATFRAERKNDSLSKVIFGVSGGEAADTAIKIARGYTKRRKIVSVRGGYHGHTGLAVATGDEAYRAPFNLHYNNFIQIEAGSITDLKREVNTDTAALILETSPATLGMMIYSEEYIQTARRLCRDSKCVLILDEIQTGWGRTGRLWGFEHYRIMPDMVLLGKGMSGGIYPISSVVYHKRFEKVFKENPFSHISTFGGSEIGCAAALKTLSTVSSPLFLKHVNRLAEIFSENMHRLMQKHSEFIEFRQSGLFMGLVMSDPVRAVVTVKAMLENGLFALYANNDRRVIQFLPPLNISEGEAEEICLRLEKALQLSEGIRYRLYSKVASWLL